MSQSVLVVGTSDERNNAVNVSLDVRCHLKYLLLVIAHILAVLESYESVLVSFTSPVLKGDTLASFLVIAPPWDLTTTRPSINMKVAHFFTSIIIHQTQIFTFVP